MHPTETTNSKIAVCKVLAEAPLEHYSPKLWKEVCAILRQFRKSLEEIDTARTLELRRTREGLIFACKRVHGYYAILLQESNTAAVRGLCWSHLGDLSRYKYLSLANASNQKRYEYSRLRERWQKSAIKYYNAAAYAGYCGGFTRMAFVAADDNDFLLAMCLCLRGIDAYRAAGQSPTRPQDFLVQCATMAIQRPSFYSGLAGAIIRSERAVRAYSKRALSREPVYNYQWKQVALVALYLTVMAEGENPESPISKRHVRIVTKQLNQVSAYREARRSLDFETKTAPNFAEVAEQVVAAEISRKWNWEAI